MEPNKEDKILATWIMCPDGTMLPSFHRHDYRTHTTVDYVARVHPDGTPEPENMFSPEWNEWNKGAETVVTDSRWSMVDGGADWYGRRGGVYTEMTVYESDPYEVIRRFVCRGGRGKNSDQPITWTPLFRINDGWLDALIEYEESRNPDSTHLKYYRMEKEYRQKNSITIPEPDAN